METRVYLDPNACVEVMWRLVGQARWHSAVNGPRPTFLMAHGLLCALDNGVKADYAFRSGTRAEFGFRLAGEEQVHVLGIDDLQLIFKNCEKLRDKSAERLVAFNSLMIAMGKPRIVRVLSESSVNQ